MKFNFVIFLYLLTVSFSVSVTLYVDKSTSCSPPLCDGSQTRPYQSISEALNKISRERINYIFVNPGTYIGTKNKDLFIESSIVFISSLSSNVTIDCENLDRAFSIDSQSMVTLNGIFIINCASSNGSTIFVTGRSSLSLNNMTISSSRSDYGAIYLSQASLVVSNSSFTSNIALFGGAAIYATQNSKVEISNSTIFNGNRLMQVNGTESFKTSDISVVDNSLSIVDYPLAKSNITAYCLSSESIVSIKSTSKSMCTKDDGDVIKCPECATHFKGFYKEEFYKCDTDFQNCQPFRKTYQYLSTFSIFDNIDGPVKGKLIGYFTIPFNSKVKFRFSLLNIGLETMVDGKKLNPQGISMEKSAMTEFSIIEPTIYLVKDQIHKIEIQYFSFAETALGQRLLKLEFQRSSTDDFIPLGDLVFYSKRICGDGIYDENEHCEQDRLYGYSNDPNIPKCGNKVCDEEPNSCIQDCFQYITEVCPPLSTRKGRSIPTNVGYDTAGQLLYNTFDWRLPGHQHLSFGFDIVTGQQQTSPIFLFDFCSQTETNVIEDTYRRSQYEVPLEMDVVFLPKCTFSQTNKMWNSSEEIRKNMASQTQTTMGGEVSFKKLPAQAAAEYSLDRSVKRSSKLKKSSSGKIIESSVLCTVSKVELTEFPLHPNFIEELSLINSTYDAIPLIRKYGTHFYKAATLGGKLTTFTSTTMSMTESEMNSKYSDQISFSFNAAVTSPVLSVNVNTDSYSDNSEENSKVEKYLSETERTSLLISGGAPGCFAPTSSSNYGYWAKSVDLLPVPVDYQLVPIREIIPTQWKTLNGSKISSLWESAENYYYKFMYRNHLFDSFEEMSRNDYLIYWFVYAAHPFAYRSEDPVTTRILANPYPYKGQTDYLTSIDLNAIPDIDSVLNQYYSCNPYPPNTVIYYPSTPGMIPCFQTEFQIRPELLKLTLDSSLYQVYFQTNNSDYVVNYTTQLISIQSTQGFGGFEVQNAVLMSTETIEFPREFRWEINSCSGMHPIPLWTFSFFNAQNMLYQNSSIVAYLRIPAQQIDYSDISMTIFFGSQKAITILIRPSQITPAGKSKLITLNQNSVAMLLAATSINFTPNITYFNWTLNDGLINPCEKAKTKFGFVNWICFYIESFGPIFSNPGNIYYYDASSEPGVMFLKNNRNKYISIAYRKSQDKKPLAQDTEHFSPYSILRDYHFGLPRDTSLIWEQFVSQVPLEKFFPDIIWDHCENIIPPIE